MVITEEVVVVFGRAQIAICQNVIPDIAESPNLHRRLWVGQSNHHAHGQKLLTDIDSRTSLDFHF